MGRQSFLFGFQSAREVLFLLEVSLSLSLFFQSMYLCLAALGLAVFGIFVPCVGFSLVAVCRLWSAQASAVA